MNDERLNWSTDNKNTKMESQSQPTPTCQEHDRLIEYFCQDDQVPICSRCYIMGEHKDHNILSFEEKNKPLISALENEIETAVIVFNKLSQLVDGGQFEKKLYSEKAQVTSTVKQCFNHLQSVLLKRERKLLEQISTHYKNKQDTMICNARSQKEKFHKAVLESKHLLENPSLVLDGENLQKTLAAAKYTPCIASKESLLKWDEVHVEDIEEAISAFGSLVIGNDDNLLKTVQDSPDEVREEDKIFKILLNTQQSCDALSVSSVDTGDDVIIESDSESLNSLSTTRSEPITRRRSNECPSDFALPQVKGSVKQVTLTHIRSPNDFFVQLELNKKKLTILSRNINSWAKKNSSSQYVPKDIKNGMYVLACYSADNQWYRARVLEDDQCRAGGDNERMVHICFIDFGNEEKLPLKDLRIMEPRFQRYPPFCIRCSLFDAAPYDNSPTWNPEAIHEFFRITLNEILLLNVIGMKGSVYEVDLVCMPTEDTPAESFSSVRDMLIFLELARFARPSQEGGLKGLKSNFRTVDFYRPSRLSNGEILDVTVMHAVSPSEIYIIPTGDEYDYYLAMMERMQEVYGCDSSDVYKLHCPRKSMVCACLDSDDRWYRGKIVSAPKTRSVSVYLTDIGTTVTVGFGQLKNLLTDFIKLPSQAVHCRLADVSYADESCKDWTQDAKVWCQTDLKNSVGVARVVRFGIETEIVLWLGQTDRSINGLLVEAGLAKSSGPSSALPSTDPDLSEGQPVRKERLAADLRKSKTKSPSAKKGASEEKQASEVTRPDEENSSSPSKKSSRRSSSTTAKKKKKSAKQSHKSDEAEKEAEEARKLKAQDIQRALSEESGDTGGKADDQAFIEIIVSEYQSPTDFYIRVKDNEDSLNELMKDLNETYNGDEIETDPNHKWSQEEFCVIRNESNSLWYRGKIRSRQEDNKLQVELLDYGNVIVAEDCDLRPLTGDFSSRLNSAAVRCYLADLIPTGTSDRNKWSKTASEYMIGAVYDKKLYIKTEGDPTEMGLPIDIIVEEEIPETAFDPVTFTYHSLKKMIVEEGLAMLDKPCKSTASTKESCLKETEEASKPVKVPDMVEIPSYDIPDLNEEIDVLPTFVDFNGVIYAQRLDWDSEITHLSEELQRFYQNDRTKQRYTWSPGHVCVAPFEDDGLWYRALIENMDEAGAKAKVFFMDYGNSVWLDVEKLREICEPLTKSTVQVYHCVLEDLSPCSHDGQWPIAVLDSIHAEVVNSPCKITYTGMQHDGLLKIRLTTASGLDLSSFLQEQGYAYSTMDLKEKFAESRAIGGVLASSALCSPPDIGDAGSSFKALATEVELPNIVYLQRVPVDGSDVHNFAEASEIARLNEELEDFEKMMKDINSLPSCGFLKLPEEGMLCLGKYSFDECWYRALCVQRQSDQDACLVVFIDYGTSESVPRDSMRTLPSEFWEFPCQGIRCHLNLLPPGGPDAVWRRDSMEAMIAALARKELSVKVVQRSPLTVELFHETPSGGLSLAYEDLLQNGLAMLPMQVDLAMLTRRMADDVEEEDETTDAGKDGGSLRSGCEGGEAGVNTNANNVCEQKAVISSKSAGLNVKDGKVVEGSGVDVDGDDEEDGEWTTDSEDEYE